MVALCFTGVVKCGEGLVAGHAGEKGRREKDEGPKRGAGARDHQLPP